MSNESNSSQSELANLVALPALARRLEVSERTLHRWHSLRIGPPRTKLGRAIFYRQADLDAWIQGRREAQT